MDYFKRLLHILKVEKEEDLKLYQQSIATSTVSERRANGWSWYPIVIKNTEIGHGDYLTVEVERVAHQDIIHQLRFGSSVEFFSNHDSKNNRLAGVVSFQSGNKLKINLRTDELPDWIRDGKLGVDLLFDNNSYDEMQGALKTADKISEQTIAPSLIKILIGEKKPTFNITQQVAPIAHLNAAQQEAVHKICTANELAIVHGPPGTGKTTTLVQAIKALIKQNHKKILVVAPSNTAVDLLSEKLADEGLNVLRVGNPARVSEQLMALTLDHKIAQHSQIKEIKKLKKQANEYRNMAHKYKRNFGRAERDQRKALFNEAHKILKEVEQIEAYITNDLLGKAEVIAATLVGANHYSVRHFNYDAVVVDEAGQALEPACWIPILKAEKLILAGDHCQLSPTIKSKEASKMGLSTTLLEKCISLHPEAVVLLNEQYRMHEKIMGYSSRYFYENKLKASQFVSAHLLFPADSPLLFIDTAGCGFDEKIEGTSAVNPEEGAFLMQHLIGFKEELSAHYKVENFPTIAIISPYKQQVKFIKDALTETPELQPYLNKISVNTIDSFQGQERDVVYISMTRSNNEKAIGFLADVKRMNVAMTRARKKPVVIGDSGTLAHFPFYGDFITYAEALNGYHSAWAFMDI